MSFLSFLPLVGTAVNAVGNLIGQKSANDANVQAVRETNQANRELAQYNWEQQIRMWNEQNRYNAPSAQMSRLKEAGLNPHLVYGNGVTGNTSGQAPTPQLAQMEAPRVEALRYGDAFQGVGDSIATHFRSQELKNQTELANSQVAAQSVENRLKLAQMISEFSRNRGLEIDNRTKQDLQKYILKGAEQSLIKQQNENYMFDTRMAREQLELEVSRNNLWMSKAQVAQVIKSTELIGANIARAYSDISLNNSKRRQIDAFIYKLGLENRFSDATFDDRVRMVSEELSKRISEAGISAKEFHMFQRFGRLDGGILQPIPSLLFNWIDSH